MIIDATIIARLEAAKACEPALAWLREQPRTLDNVVRERPDWVLWAAGEAGLAETIGPATIDLCAKCRPWKALEHASALLTRARRAWCVAQMQRDA